MEAWREELYLQHHGILGMKWGVRRYQNKDGSLTALGEKHLGIKSQPDKLNISKYDSSVTKRVKKAYNELDDITFARKYSVSKKEYAKRVEKYGDPYMNSPLAKMGKVLAGKQLSKNDKKIQRLKNKNMKLEQDINSFNPIRNGLKDKKGNVILTKDDVDGLIAGLQSRIDANDAKINNLKELNKGRSYVETHGFDENTKK